MIIGCIALYAFGLAFFSGLLSKPSEDNKVWGLVIFLWPVAVPLVIVALVGLAILEQLFSWGEQLYKKI